MPTIPVRFEDPGLLKQWEVEGYDRVAPGYSAFTREATAAGRALLLDRTDLAPGQSVLDLCSGPGWLTIEAARAVAPGGRVVGFDISANMVATAQANAREAGAENVEFRQGDGEDLPFSANAFDRALCSLGLMHIPDPARALAELARVLVPGGLLVATVWGPEGETFLDLMSAAFAESGEELPLDLRYAVRLGDPDLLAHLARDSGFSGAEAAPVPAVLPFPDAGAFWDAFQGVGGLFAGLIDRLSPAGRARARAAFVELCSPYRAENGCALPASQVMLVARR